MEDYYIMIYIHELLLNFILNNKIKFIFFILFTGLLYPLHHILIPDYYGKIIGSLNSGTSLPNKKEKGVPSV